MQPLCIEVQCDQQCFLRVSWLLLILVVDAKLRCMVQYCHHRDVFGLAVMDLTQQSIKGAALQAMDFSLLKILHQSFLVVAWAMTPMDRDGKW